MKILFISIYFFCLLPVILSLMILSVIYSLMTLEGLQHSTMHIFNRGLRGIGNHMQKIANKVFTNHKNHESKI